MGISLHSPYTAKNSLFISHIFSNIQKFTHPLRMTTLLGASAPDDSLPFGDWCGCEVRLGVLLNSQV